MALFHRPLFKKISLLVMIALGLYLVFAYLVPLVIPFMLGLLIAFLLQTPIRFMEENCGWRRHFAVTACLVLFGAVFLIAAIFLVKWIVNQGKNLMQAYPFYHERFLYGMSCCCTRIDGWFSLKEGASYAYMAALLAGINETFSGTLLPKITSGSLKVMQSVFDGIIFCFVVAFTTILFTRHYKKIGETLRKNAVGTLACKCGHSVCSTLGAYIRAQAIIMTICAVLFAASFYFMGNRYYIITAAAIAFLDALPLIGSGLILVPWALVLFFMGAGKKALCLLGVFLVASCLREFLEPKLIGDRIGMSSLTSIFCMYVGLQLFGLLGFLFGPIAFLIGKEIYETLLPEV